MQRAKQAELNAIKERVHAKPDQPGHFWLVSPLSGTVLTPNFREEMTTRLFKPNEQILRVGDKDGRWEIELKIPQKHIGQILQAFKKDPKKELDVDLLLMSESTQVFKGKLSRDKISGQANPNRDDNMAGRPPSGVGERDAGFIWRGRIPSHLCQPHGRPAGPYES